MHVQFDAIGEGLWMIASFEHADDSSRGELIGHGHHLPSKRLIILRFQTERTHRIEPVCVEASRDQN